ncbi:MAG: ABC transporter ATP-binding protein [Candidatus Aenigmarchaeota archaeon]|nr:ABC transporter ATP-binding protein [Candidatus Aenigmarchaeota archaeon]
MKKKIPVIEVRNVEKIYKMGDVEVPALDGVDIVINRGEFVAIMGPSGSGKSTAMNMVGCLDVPTKGKVFLDGHDISQLGESELAQIRGKKIGFIFQTFNLINSISAIENVELPMIFQGVSKDERMEIAKKLLCLVDLGDRMYHKPTEMSGGQQQRVAVARALANDPEVILADEPTGNLDSKTGKEIIELIGKLNKEGKTIIMVTHDEDIAKHAQRIVRLKDGKVV